MPYLCIVIDYDDELVVILFSAPETGHTKRRQDDGTILDGRRATIVSRRRVVWKASQRKRPTAQR